MSVLSIPAGCWNCQTPNENNFSLESLGMNEKKKSITSNFFLNLFFSNLFIHFFFKKIFRPAGIEFRPAGRVGSNSGIAIQLQLSENQLQFQLHLHLKIRIATPTPAIAIPTPELELELNVWLWVFMITSFYRLNNGNDVD